MRASLVRAQKLLGDPSLLHCLTGFDTVSSRAFSPFAHAQKPILPNSIIIKRTSDATFVTPVSSILSKITRRSLLSYHRLPCLKGKSHFLCRSIDWFGCLLWLCARAFNHCLFSLIKLRASSSGEKALFFRDKMLTWWRPDGIIRATLARTIFFFTPNTLLILVC